MAIPADWNERRLARKARNEPHNKWLREISREELEKALASGELLHNEYVGEVNRRAHWEAMNPKDLEFQATFDPWAEVELKRRKGELPR